MKSKTTQKKLNQFTLQRLTINANGQADYCGSHQYLHGGIIERIDKQLKEGLSRCRRRVVCAIDPTAFVDTARGNAIIDVAGQQFEKTRSVSNGLGLEIGQVGLERLGLVDRLEKVADGGRFSADHAVVRRRRAVGFAHFACIKGFVG